MTDVHPEVLGGSGSTIARKLDKLDVRNCTEGGSSSDPDIVQKGEEKAPSLQETSRAVSEHPESFVIVHNVAKRHNIGTLARSATAFGVSMVCAVGRRDFNTFGSHGAADHVEFKHFFTLSDARRFLKEERGCTICGVEIVDSAVAVQHHPFTGNTAFVLGNEGMGLSEKEMEICDSFVYIPQHGPGTASLNVTVAASIVLHHFAVWARLPERERNGQKFVVADRPVRRGPRNMCPESEEELAERRAQRASQNGRDWSEEGATSLFEEEEEEGQAEIPEALDPT